MIVRNIGKDIGIWTDEESGNPHSNQSDPEEQNSNDTQNN